MRRRTIFVCVCKLLPEGTAASPICFLDSEGLRLSKNRKSLRKSTERELHSFAGVSTVKFMVYAEAGRKGRHPLCSVEAYSARPRNTHSILNPPGPSGWRAALAKGCWLLLASTPHLKKKKGKK